MRNTLVLILVFICVTRPTAYSQWTKKLTLPRGETLQFLSAPADRIVWALTRDRNIYITLNGGNKWTHYAAQGINPNTTVEWIFAFDSSTALLAVNTDFTGHGPGIMYHTSDGGHNWTEVFSHIGNCDFRIGMDDRSKGLLVVNSNNLGSNSHQELFATLDGGISWNKKLITDPTSFYLINALFVRNEEVWLQASDSLYYSNNLGIAWRGEKLAPNVAFNQMQFENRNYGIGNNGPLIDLYVKRLPSRQWQNMGDPTNTGGAVTGLVLNGPECWLSEALDALPNYYSADSCRTFVPVIVDPQGAFLILQKAWKGNDIWGATGNSVYVDHSQKANILPE